MAQRHMPFGYKIIDGVVTIESEKTELIRKMFDDFIAGKSLKQMANDLTELKILNANGKPSWNHCSIGKILSNCKYIGNDYYPAVVTDEIFNTVKTLREDKNILLGRNTNYYANGISSTYPFSGKVICGECGSAFRRYTEHHDKNKKSNWKCKRYIVDNRVCCKSGVIDDKQLETAFAEIIRRIIEYPNLIEKHPTIKEAEKDSNLVNKLEMEIHQCLNKNNEKTSVVRKLLFNRAAEQYRIAQVDGFEHQTAKLQAVMKTFKTTTEFNEDLFKATIKTITVFTAEQLQFELINGIILNTTYKLRKKGGNSHGNSTKNSISHTSKSDL